MEFKEWLESDQIINAPLVAVISESTSARYSVEVTYRSEIDEILDAAAKIILGYVSAAMKQNDFHTKHVYEEKPLRVVVASRNFDDGEWVGLVSYNPEHRCFIISKGFYNKDRKTVSIQGSKKCHEKNAAEIVKELRNQMHDLKGKKDRHVEKLKAVPLKRGPKN